VTFVLIFAFLTQRMLRNILIRTHSRHFVQSVDRDITKLN